MRWNRRFARRQLRSRVRRIFDISRCHGAAATARLAAGSTAETDSEAAGSLRDHGGADPTASGNPTFAGAAPAQEFSRLPTTPPANYAPVASRDAYSIDEDTPLVIAIPGVLSNDGDADGDPLTAYLVSGPAHGTLTFDADGSFTYGPDADYSGADSFTYSVADGGGQASKATVNIAVLAVADAPT